MGNITRHELDFEEPNQEEERNRLQEYLVSTDNEYNMRFMDIFENDCNWRERDADMTKLSKAFPYILFTLTGWGCENEDIWRAFYKNGKSYDINAEITFEPFNESKI